MADLQEELARVIEFNQLMKRKVGNREHIYLQAQLLVEEGIKELAEACFEKNRTKLRDALADTVVVAMGGYYIAGGKGIPVALLSGDCLGDIVCYVGDTITAAANDNCDVKSDFETVIDAVTGFALAEDVNLSADLKAVNDSNFSKFCLRH